MANCCAFRSRKGNFGMIPFPRSIARPSEQALRRSLFRLPKHILEETQQFATFCVRGTDPADNAARTHALRSQSQPRLAHSAAKASMRSMSSPPLINAARTHALRSQSQPCLAHSAAKASPAPRALRPCLARRGACSFRELALSQRRLLLGARSYSERIASRSA